MTNTEALNGMITQDQILEVLLKFDEGRKIEASRLLQAYLFDKWQITVLEAYGIISNIQKEFN